MLTILKTPAGIVVAFLVVVTLLPAIPGLPAGFEWWVVPAREWMQ